MACMVVLLIEDDNDGNRATFRCQLAKGHSGKHRRSFARSGKDGKQGEVVIGLSVRVR